MFNLEWLKNLIKREPEPSLDERIAAQVAALRPTVIEETKLIINFRDRLSRVEARSESVDAFYVKTVTQALSERQDAMFNKVWNQWADDSKAMSLRVEGVIYRIDDLVAELQKERAKTDAVNLRIDALVSKLRAGLE